MTPDDLKMTLLSALSDTRNLLTQGAGGNSTPTLITDREEHNRILFSRETYYGEVT